MFPLRLEARQRCPFLSLVFTIAQKDLARAIGQKKKKKENEGMQIRKK